MTVASRVRRIYERRPYPPPPSRETSTSWALNAIPWIEAVAETPRVAEPRRILIAGCGVGTEAFAFAKRFPAAEVVGVDFSPRSIATAKRLAGRWEVGDRVRFEVADLSGPDLPDIAGKAFDVISCHGVLSYIEDAVAVFRNFARCMTPDGIALLGVNGEAHPSVRWRSALPTFGIDPEEFRETGRVRQTLRVFDSLTRYPPVSLAGTTAGYLAGDLFGPLNRAVSLREWVGMSGKAGLHLVATYNAYFALRLLLNGDLHEALMPRSRPELDLLVDDLEPSSFHQIVLARRRPQRIAWNDGRSLLSLRPELTGLYTVQWPPRRRRSWHRLGTVVLQSVTTQTKITLEIPEWEIGVLRGSDGTRSLRQLMEPVRPAVPARTLSAALYLVYLLGLIRLRPPEGR